MGPTDLALTGDKEWESTRRSQSRWIECLAWGGDRPPEILVALDRRCELSGALVPTPERFAQLTLLRVAALEEHHLDRVLAPAPGSAAAWELEHPEEMEKYSGQFVAVHPDLGIVAASPDPLVVIAEVRSQGRAREVVIRAVRTRVTRR